MATMICPNCGKAIPADAVICPKCGYQLNQTKVAGSAQNPQKGKKQSQGQGVGACLKKVSRHPLKNKWLLTLLGVLFFGLLFFLFHQYQLHQQAVRTQQQTAQMVNTLKQQNQTVAKQEQQIQEDSNNRESKNTKRPILLLHGFGGTYNSEKYIAASLNQSRTAKQQLIVYVDKKNHIHLIGKYQPTVVQRIIIPIVIAKNHAGEFYYSDMLAKIMPKLNRKYHIKSYDAIGHSMGSYAWINYFETHSDQTRRIKPNRLVTIAGPFNGILDLHKSDQPAYKTQIGRLWDDHVGENSFEKNGRPKIERPEFRHLLKYRHRLPAELSILNIYGNLKDGTDSDGLVTTVSARSLGYLVKTSNVKVAYREKQITGPKAQHSLLHVNNLKVNRLIKCKRHP